MRDEQSYSTDYAKKDIAPHWPEASQKRGRSLVRSFCADHNIRPRGNCAAVCGLLGY